MIRSASRSGSVVVLAVTVASLISATASAQNAPGADLQRSALQIASAHGKEVRVTSMNGAQRKGRLVSFSTSEVVFSEHGHDVSMALGEVWKVETVHHTARNAAIAGAVGGFIVGCKGCGDDSSKAVTGALYGGIGAGAAAIVGALISMAAADKHVVYEASTPSVHIVPTITPTRSEVSLAVRW